MSSDPAPPTRARVLLVGLGPTAESALASLLARHLVVGLVRSGGDDDAVVRRARAAGVPVHRDTSVAGLADAVGSSLPDCVVVSSFDRILPPDLLQTCPFVNVHYSPLPRYRGRANVNWAVINGEAEAAISVHELVPDLDAGGILYQQAVPIGPRTTATELYDSLNLLQQRELGSAVDRLLSGDRGTVQNASAASYGCTRLPEDGEVAWSGTTAAADRLVRGLTPPAPGAFTYLGLQRLWIDEAEPVPDGPRYDGRIPGRVVAVSRRHGYVDVLTGDGLLRLHTVRKGDGGRQPAAAVVLSVRTTLGLRTVDLLREIADLRAQVVGLVGLTGDPSAG